MNELEDLMIYKQYLELMSYMDIILLKFPKIERNGLISTIKKDLYDGMRYVIEFQKEKDNSKKITYLNKVDTNLKMIAVLMRLALRKKYINGRNYEAYSKKVFNISNLLGAHIKKCLRR